MSNKALIYIELDNNKAAKVSKEIISHALHNFRGFNVDGIVLGDKESINAALDDLRELNVQNLFIVQNELLNTKNTSLYAQILADFIFDNRPEILLIGATEDGRDIAPRLASKLNIGLTADCTDLQIDDAANLIATRPTYGGKLMASIASKTTPNFATVRSGAFKYSASLCKCTPNITYITPDITEFIDNPKIISIDYKQVSEDWTCSDVIVAGGLGLTTKENFDLIYKLAELLKAKPAASRAAVEQGWAPQDIQVGQTGNSVSPKLYIAFGISGAMQHTAGITNSDKIIAVNTDKDAPIMHSADFAIECDAVDVINSLIQKLSN